MPRAWQIHDYSGYQGLVLEEVEIAQPGAGEIRLKIEAFALNWGDMDLMRDQYSFSFSAFPARIGMEATGIVDAIGPGVENISLGERFCTLPHFYDNRGASADTLIIAPKYVTKAPPGLSPVEASAIWMQYMTAYFPLAELSSVGPGTQVLVTAATGTAGTAALQIGRMLGATMIGTTRFDHNRDFLREAGADHVIVTSRENIADRLNDITGGHGIDMAFDPVGGDMMRHYSPALARDARIYYYGHLDGMFTSLPLVDMFQANAWFHPYSLFNYVQDEAACARGRAFVYEALETGKIKPLIDKVFAMEEYKTAWDYLKAPRRSHGKLIVKTGL